MACNISVDKPHAVCIPTPTQSHVKSMLKLAKLLHYKGFHITFVNTEFNHSRLLRSRGPDSMNGLPDFRFESIPDGLPSSDENATQNIREISEASREGLLGPFNDMLDKLNGTESSDVPPVTCIVSDGFMPVAIDAAAMHEVPIALFFTISACSFMGFRQFQALTEKGLTPLKGGSTQYQVNSFTRKGTRSEWGKEELYAMFLLVSCNGAGLEGVGHLLPAMEIWCQKVSSLPLLVPFLGSCIRNGTASGSSQEQLFRAPFLARLYATEASLRKEDSSTEGNSFKGHDMLAPFTAGWQSNDLDHLVIEKSEGSYVYDINGKKYLDALAGLWCTSLGGDEPRLVAAATEQLNKLPFYHSFWNRTTKPSLAFCLSETEAPDLAKELLETFTASKMAKAFFTNSGSEANDTQVKLVWYYNNALGRPNKKKFIARAKSYVDWSIDYLFQFSCWEHSQLLIIIFEFRWYHGSTLIAASLSGLPALHQKFDLPAPFVRHTDCPHYWRYHLPGETEEEFSTRLANNLENLILKEGPETIAAFIAEPVMGAGGIQAAVKKYDILFIADEVIRAFGRLGTMYGSDKFNIKPDLVSVAKALSSGYLPIGAVMVSPEVSDVIDSQSSKLGSFSHGFTYSGHPVACAVAIETLKIYKERNILDQVNRIAPNFKMVLPDTSPCNILSLQIRGTGLILGTEFVDNNSPNDPFPPEWGVGAYFGAQCEKEGMLVRVAGDNIMMCPPFIMSPEEVGELISKHGKALGATEERVKELKSQHKKQ
ncbi:hypothetical protein DKX38_023500 [Salix brachista]|uniref:Uncharacterized protein n=1 Tax=Salix brachista TaxID=2182728 RepID=A0A5N5JJ21_9ROSI|nr:hypothetical protein DKX38_023500 [Salix brachista]